MPEITGGTAIDQPRTQDAWRTARRRARMALTLSLLLIPAGILAALLVPGLDNELFLAAVVVAMFAGGIPAERRLDNVKRIRRVLEVYPWQTYTQAVYADENGRTYFRLPDPDNPQKSVRVPVRGPLSRRRWSAALGNAVQEFWFAGDPRFRGVIALSGPRGLTLIRRADASDWDEHKAPRGVSDEAWRRAWAAITSGERKPAE